MTASAPPEPALPRRRLPPLPPWAQPVLRVGGWVAAVGLAVVLAMLLLAGVGWAVASRNLPDIASLADYRPKLPLRIFSADGQQIGEFGEERRNFMRIAEMPQVMKDAVLAAEDARFYQHGGVDYRGVLRAALANLRDSRSEGASTITMQVARNFYLPTTKTYTRKLYEALLALELERQLSKDQILELYMNQIFLGHRAHGFAAASEIYFGKKLGDISVAEAAMLAGVPKAPSAYNPLTNRRRATVRQRYIIERMYETGFITEEQHEAALKEELRYRTPVPGSDYAEFVSEMARQLVYNQYGEDTYSRGLDVYLTLNAADQQVAWRALRRGLIELELRQFYRGPEAYVDLPADPELVDDKVAQALADHPDNGELRSAVVLEASPQKVVAMLQNGDTFTVTGTGLRPVTSGLSARAPQKIAIRPGAVVRAMQVGTGTRTSWTLTQIPQIQGAFVAIDPNTGWIRALVGGFDFGKNKFNRVTQAWRQPGSAFKPFIYSGALEMGITPATVVNDAPLFFSAAETGSQPWEPKNYDGRFDGPMPLQTALAKSKNMVSIRVLQATGVDFSQRWLQNFGFEAARHPPYLTIALGAGTVTPLQMATAYGVFANGGYLVAPQLIQRVTDHRGRVLMQAKPVQPDESLRTLSPRNAFVMSSLLQEVTRSGTAARAQATLRRPDLYGKTGTTNDSMDVWFAGFQPTLAAVVWIGHDSPKKLGDRETGGGLALPIWMEFMQHALKEVPVQEMQPPAGVVREGPYWMFEEYAHGAGVAGLGLEDQAPRSPSVEERSTILDLFRR